jgi:hypothetical protein
MCEGQPPIVVNGVVQYCEGCVPAFAIAEFALLRDELRAAQERISAIVLAEMGAVMVAMDAAGVSCGAVRATARSKLEAGGYTASSLLDDLAEMTAQAEVGCENPDPECGCPGCLLADERNGITR